MRSAGTWNPPTAVPLGSAVAFILRSHTPQAAPADSGAQPSYQELAFLPSIGLLTAIYVLETCPELHCNQRLLLSHPPSFTLSFHRCQTRKVLWKLPLPQPACSPLYLSQVLPPINLLYFSPILASGSWRTHPRLNFFFLSLEMKILYPYLDW